MVFLNNQGWIKLHRKIRDNPLHKDCNAKQRDILINLLLMVNYTSNKWIYKGEEFEIKPGQLITSLDTIANSCAKDVSVQNVRTALLKFEKYGFLTNKSTNKNRLITIVNWELYQEEYKNQQTNQQATNKQLTTIKESKNVRNKKLFVETSDEYRLAKYLFKLIRENNPTHKEPNLQNWAKDIDKMIRLDKREVDDIEAVIYWCQHDDFWSRNVLSTSKLRIQYDQLKAKMKPKQPTQIIEKPKGKIIDFKIGGE